MKWHYTPAWKRAAREVKKLQGARVKVGILAAEQHSGDITIAGVATLHEYGNPRSGHPERSFIRRTFREKKSDLESLITAQTKKVMGGSTSAQKAMNTLGVWGAGAVKKTIIGGVSPPNAPSTVRRKKSSKPLVDTSQLIGAVTHKVEFRIGGI